MARDEKRTAGQGRGMSRRAGRGMTTVGGAFYFRVSRLNPKIRESTGASANFDSLSAYYLQLLTYKAIREWRRDSGSRVA